MLCALGVAPALAFALPSVAAAETFTVNTTEESTEANECLIVTKCSLSGAIEAANETEAKDTIEFAEAAEGTIAAFTQLKIEQPIEIDGTSAPNYAGKPVVEIEGPNLTTLGLYLTSGAAGSTIRGLGVGGFETGIALEGDDQQVCGSYLGVEPDGATALPNDVGISIEEDTTGDQIGAGCESIGDGNLISGNTTDGIVDFGGEAQIAGNRIGVDATGAALANGEGNAESAGIAIEPASTGAVIGPSGLEGANTIAHNRGPGIIVARRLNEAKIRTNSIYANERPGIAIGAEAPVAPTINEVIENAGTVSVKGEVTTPGAEEVQLDFFASEACTAGTRGGQTFLGTESLTSVGGATPFEAELPESLPQGENYVTVTATESEVGQTSEFSECFHYEAPPAGQQTFVVSGLEDTGGAAGCEDESVATECTLRGAIEAANKSEALDTVEFAASAEGTIETLDEFRMEDPIDIDGTSAPGYDGIPLVQVKGPNLSTLGFDLTEGAAGSTISGLAVGGFQAGVTLEGSDQRVCGSYLGVGLDGMTAVPNRVGASIEEGTTGDEIGAGCELIGDGNLISGNTFGIIDLGSQTLIAANRIGIDATGAPLPNGDPSEGAGIGVERGSTAAIGPAGLESANTIAYNLGPGVLVTRPSAKAAIRGNSIFENELQGIETANEASVPPKVTKVKVGSDSLTIEGEATAPGAETIELDFFAGPTCSIPGGQTFLGQWNVSGVAGTNGFEAELAGELPTGEEYITATSTGSVGGQTTEFSECFLYVAPPGPQTFTVSGLEDTADAAGCEDATTATECTLRGAIEAADKTEALDTIDFAASAEGVIEVDGFGDRVPLPEITGPVMIDGTSAPGYEGEPVVELDGTETDEEGNVYGLDVGAGHTVIKGLAIGGFVNGLSDRAGIYLGGDEGHSQVCSSWIGVGLDGTKLPNGVGIEVEPSSVENEIGVGCGANAPPNVIAGNLTWGIEDHGQETEIGSNRIGISSVGDPLGNELGGVRVAEDADAPKIGSSGKVVGAPGPNQIAYNEGPGILVERGGSRVRIRHNAIFGNTGKGIEILAPAPAPPTIEAVEATSGGITVKGIVTSGEEEPIELDFFASAVCDPLSAGEGESFLGEGEIDESVPSANPYTATVAAPSSDDQTFITVTATAALGGATSEFSDCFKYVPPEPEPEHHEEPKPPVQNNVTTPLPNPPPAEGIIPTNGEKVVVKPEEGKVKIKLPGTKKYASLTELKEIPVGAVIDATNGRVTLTSIDPDGTEQTAEFFGGVFKVKQKEGSGVVVLEMLDTNICPVPTRGTGKGASPRAAASSVAFRPKSSTAGKLWGSGHGNFRTEGNDGSATVRGTIWLVEDRCNGTTFFKTRSGIVSVRDFIKNKTVPLPAGKTYLAGEK